MLAITKPHDISRCYTPLSASHDRHIPIQQSWSCHDCHNYTPTASNHHNTHVTHHWRHARNATRQTMTIKLAAWLLQPRARLCYYMLLRWWCWRRWPCCRWWGPGASDSTSHPNPIPENPKRASAIVTWSFPVPSMCVQEFETSGYGKTAFA